MARRVPDDNEVSRRLFEAWNDGPDWNRALVLAREVPVPGKVSLRGRFHLLTDVTEHEHDPAEFATGWATWSRQVSLTDAADRALAAQRIQDARDAATELLTTVEPARHPLPAVDALIVLGDASMQYDDIETAIDHYDAALELAAGCGYRFGRLRALVPLGYLTLRVASAEQARRLLDEADVLGRELDERAYRANALAGRGDALTRLGRLELALESLNAALELFQSIQSSGGIVNTCQHLGDLYRRSREPEQAERYLKVALDTSRESGPHLGIINAADALGEVRLGQGDLSGAIGYFELALNESGQDQRGRANALNGLGRCAAADDNFEESITLHRGALDLFRALGDPSSAAYALNSVAGAEARRGNRQGCSDAMSEAIEEIESLRTAQDRHRSQQELRTRHASLYANALRASIDADDPVAYATAFEALAGGRLAALIEQASLPAIDVTGQVLAQAQRHRIDGSDLPEQSAAARRTRLLGRLALKHALPDIARTELDEATTAFTRPVRRDDVARLLRLATHRTQALLITAIPGTAQLGICLGGPNGLVLRTVDVPAPAVALVKSLATDGLDRSARLADLAALSSLLPAYITAALDPDLPLVIVPLDELWAVPWPAIPLPDGHALGETVPLSVAPSLAIAARTLTLSAHSFRPQTVALWRNPTLKHHLVRAFNDSAHVQADPLPSASHAREAIISGGYDLVVAAGHGKPLLELGHYLGAC